MNQISSSYQYPLRLFDMNFMEISHHLRNCPSLIIPVGGMEPIGSYGATGIVTRCSEQLAEALSSKLRVLTAPPVCYSYSLSFKSFEGCAGVNFRTFSNLILELCKDWIFQGFKHILLINTASGNDESIQLAIKRLNCSCEFVKCFSFQTDSRVQSFVKQYKSGVEFGRSEFSILSLAQYLFPNLVTKNRDWVSNHLPDQKQYETWKKRGKDPQKFRKLFPLGSTSEIAGENSMDFGRELFSFVEALLENEFSPFLIASEHAA